MLLANLDLYILFFHFYITTFPFSGEIFFFFLSKFLCSYVYFIFAIVLVIFRYNILGILKKYIFICWIFINHIRIDCGLIGNSSQIPPKEFTHGFLLVSYMGQRMQHINYECSNSIPNGIGIKGLVFHYFLVTSTSFQSMR